MYLSALPVYTAWKPKENIRSSGSGVKTVMLPLWMLDTNPRSSRRATSSLNS